MTRTESRVRFPPLSPKVVTKYQVLEKVQEKTNDDDSISAERSQLTYPQALMSAFLAQLLAHILEIINLLKAARGDKKSALEIEKLTLEIRSERDDLALRSNLIRPATFAEVEEFDPKISAVTVPF